MDIRQLVNRSIKLEIEDEETTNYSNNYSKKKRFRSAFTTDQIKGLEKQYKKYPYIGIVNRKAIAKTLNIPEKAVKIWFQNRRMKEKKDKTQNNNDETHKAINLVNNQSTSSSGLQSSNGPVSNKISPQIKPRTGLTKERGIFRKSYAKLADNVTLTLETDMENNSVMTNNVTSSTNDNIAKSSVELPKKYKNHLPSTIVRPRQKIFHKTRHELTDKNKYTRNTHPKFLQQATHTSASLPQRHINPQIPAGFVPPYIQNTQSSYQQACLTGGNVIWKSIDQNMSNAMPVNQFALVPHPTPPNLNVQGRKCFCNCHGNSQQNLAYPQENQLPPPQYVFAVPFQNAPPHFTYPIQR